jgi:hypothetical protein
MRIWKRLSFLSFLIFFAVDFPTIVHADDSAGQVESSQGGSSALSSLRASGWTSADYFHSDNHLDTNANFYEMATDLKLSMDFNDSFSGKIEARALDNNEPNERGGVSSLLEGYLSYRSDQWHVKLGKQIVAWGRTDGINPTDNLTPHDYVVMLPFEQDQRVGTPALYADNFVNEELTLSLFATPYFEPTRLPLPLGQADLVTDKPHSGAEAGVRLNKAGGNLDWSISYYHGHMLFPDLYVQSAASSLPVLALTFPEMNVVGADFAFNAGRYGVRGELAYSNVIGSSDDDPFARKPYFYAVIGADRSFDDDLNVNFQVFGRWIQNYSNPDSTPAAEQQLAVLDAIIGQQQDRQSFGFTSRIAKKWLNQTLSTEILAVVNCTRRNSYLKPLASYDATDHLKLSIGANFYRGPTDSFFGRLSSDSGVFAEGRYSY